MKNYTPRAQQAIQLARKEADRLKHAYVGTEHLLLGLISLGQGVVARVFEQTGINLEHVKSEIERAVAQGSSHQEGGTLPYTPRMKKIIALAEACSRDLSHPFVGTEHLLLGLLREGEGAAARVLRDHGLNHDNAKEYIMKEHDCGDGAPDQKKEGGAMIKMGVSVVCEVQLYTVKIGITDPDRYYVNPDDATLAGAIVGNNQTPRSVIALKLSDGTFIETPKVISISEPPSEEEVSLLLKDLTPGQLIAAKRGVKKAG